MALFLFLISPIKPFLYTPFLFFYYYLCYKAFFYLEESFQGMLEEESKKNMERGRGTRTKQQLYVQGVHFRFS